MKRDSASSDREASLKDQVAEDLALRHALKLTRLEQAASAPSISWVCWIAYLVFGGVLLYLRDDLVDSLWLIIMLLLVQIHLTVMSVHSRIDAILELDKLRSERPIPNLANKKQAEQGGDGDAEEAV